MKKYIGTMFIVPNAACLKVGFFSESISGANYYDLAVNVWCYDDTCDNWQDHGGPLTGHNLPYSLICGVKEGETVEIEGYDRDGEKCIFQLTAMQRTSRYRDYGLFEEALDFVTAVPNYPSPYEKEREALVPILEQLYKTIKQNLKH